MANNRVRHQKEVRFSVAHRRVVFATPTRLRLQAGFDRTILGKLYGCTWTCVKVDFQRLVGRDGAVPGINRCYWWRPTRRGSSRVCSTWRAFFLACHDR